MLEKENSEFKPAKLCLKIDLVSHPAYARKLDKYINLLISCSLATYHTIYLSQLRSNSVGSCLSISISLSSVLICLFSYLFVHIYLSVYISVCSDLFIAVCYNLFNYFNISLLLSFYLSLTLFLYTPPLSLSLSLCSYPYTYLAICSPKKGLIAYAHSLKRLSLLVLKWSSMQNVFSSLQHLFISSGLSWISMSYLGKNYKKNVFCWFQSLKKMHKR